MEKAYDLADLGKKLAASGVPALKEFGEAEAKEVYIQLKAWLVESAALSTNKIDDMIAPFYGQLDGLVLPLIDKIDGQVG